MVKKRKPRKRNKRRVYASVEEIEQHLGKIFILGDEQLGYPWGPKGEPAWTRQVTKRVEGGARAIKGTLITAPIK